MAMNKAWLLTMICATNIVGEIIEWNFKPKQFVQKGARFERKCQTVRSLATHEKIFWLLHYHDGRTDLMDCKSLVFDSYSIDDEGIAICQVKDTHGHILDERHFFLTSDPTELIDDRFEGYEQVMIDSEVNNVARHCSADAHIEYRKEEVADFHIDFVQHYERVRLHSHHIQFQRVQHENEGYYECMVRLFNGLVGVRVFFLSVGGGPRQVSLRETRLHAERHDSITLLCPIFSALPAWYTFVVPQPRVAGISALTGHDYLRLRNLSDLHSGVFTCRVTTSEADDGYSLTSTVHLDVFGPPVRIEPYPNEYVQIKIEKKTEHLLHCSMRGNPIPNYYWFSGDVHTLKTEAVIWDQIDFRFVPKENHLPHSKPIVTCIAKNNRGTQRQVFVLQLEN